MEVVTSLSTNINGANGGTKKHIQEWSRLDKLTGMLEHARVEADHWASNTSNSRHHFGKVVDSRARNLADGSVQQKQQTKQLEVFQAHIPGGSVQVIRSHTSTTSSWHNSKVLQSQSSSWSSSPADNLLNRHIGDMEVEIDNLKFDHNPVNLDSEKSKANIARSLGNRRPPTRSKMTTRANNEDAIFTHLPITYDFHEIKEENKDKMNEDIGKNMDSASISPFSSSVNTSTMETNREKLDKKKSISDENLSFSSHLDDEKAEEKESSYPWIRSCRVRRSFQHPPTSRFKTKMENSAELVAANKSDLENVLGKVLRRRADFESYSKTASTVEVQKPTPILRKKSFVTEATLQETKRKLRHLTNDKAPILRNSLEEIDDGIFTESKSNSDKENEKSNISEDLDDMVIKSSSPKCLDVRLINKSDDWFDRRKSYGFEPVRQQNIASSLNSTPKTNSSTDSGICRSSELELASTSIIKKVTEAKEDVGIRSANDEEGTKFHGEFAVKNDIPELLKKFEKFDKPKTSGATIVTFTESRDVIKKGKVLEAIKNFEKNGISRKMPELTSLTKSGSYFLEDLNEKPNQLSVDSDFLAKRHSIACDDTKYVTSTFTIPQPSFPEKAPSPAKSTVVNVNNFESSNTSSPFTDLDTKKPKKVEFSKTEVHFAATEPGKIRIVETNEKPPPTNLYRRKKRSVSVSPKSDLPQTKYGVFENLTNPENTPDNKSNDDSSSFRSHFTSTVSDNGLAVTITSAKPTDYRRASWSVIENSNSSPVHFENKAGYSTKINFGGEGVTVVADAKSLLEKTTRESHISSTKTINKSKIPDTSQNGENIHERLIVSIGGSVNNNSTTGKYVQKPTFTNSFRNSIKSSKAATDLEKLTSKKSDSLKSTSLIISTIKQSVNKKSLEKSNNDIMEKENKITNVKIEKSKPRTEQPSTYITEMNKLQRKYRVKETQSTINGVVKNDKTKSRFYNTIPAVKNGHTRSKLLTNDLPAVLSAFDNLCRTIDEVMEKKTNVKHQNARDRLKVVENLSVAAKSIYDERSSQSKFLDNAVSRDDGNISDDSLKADKEVQSYMSTAIMEEYENELCGSWSRKRYFKHIKPIKIVQQDEISEKCHFKPLKNDEDEFKIIANVTDIKKPKIASVATMKLDDHTLKNENSSGNPKKSTVLLNKSPRIETAFDDPVAKEQDDCVEKTRTARRTTNPNPPKTSDYVNVADYREPKRRNHSTVISAEEISKNENDPVKVIYHDIELIGKVPQNENEKKSYLGRKDNERDSLKLRRKISSRDSVVNNGSIRRQTTKSASSKEKLPDSGRDGWLNLPKERKILSEKKSVENGKHEIYRKPHIDHVKKERRTRSGINGCGDISSEEDSVKRSSKVYIPLSTIHEKSKITKVSKHPVTKMASNSSTENQSSSFEFKNPVLKTEERSRRRAARMLQRASSREMLMNSNVASSSDDITSENELHHSRSSKPRNIRKLKSSPKTTKTVTTTSNLPPKKTITSSAKMQINIFNIKDRANNEKRSTYIHNTSSKSSNCIDDSKSSRCRPQTSQQKIYANITEKSRTKPISCTNKDTRNLSTSAVKSTRTIR